MFSIIVQVWMVSEFALPKDVVPEFQIFSSVSGERMGKEEERRLINNENMEAKMFKDHVLMFKTPTQDVNNLNEIISRNYEIKLVARRKSDNAHSKPFPFFFFTHNEIPMMSDMNDDGSHSCLYCSIYANEEMPSIKQAIPGEKKRKIPSSADKKKTSKSRRMSEALSNGSGILSPDSGISPNHDSFENLIHVHQVAENGISHNPLGSAARVEEVQEESHNHNGLENGTSLEVAENTKEMLVDGSTEENSNSEELTGAEDIIAEILEKESQSPGIVEEEILDPEMFERLSPDEIPEDLIQAIETDQAKAKNEVKEETKKPKSRRPPGIPGTNTGRESVDATPKERHSAKPESVQHMSTATAFKQSILHDYADILTDTKNSLIPRLVLVFLLLALQLGGHRTEERTLSKLVYKIKEVFWTFPFLLLMLLILISSLGWLDESFAGCSEDGGLLLGMLASLAAGTISVAIARTV